MEELDSVQKFIEIQGWLLLTFYVYTINLVLLILLSYRCLKNIIHQAGGKNEWLLLSVTSFRIFWFSISEVLCFIKKTITSFEI